MTLEQSTAWDTISFAPTHRLYAQWKPMWPDHDTPALPDIIDSPDARAFLELLEQTLEATYGMYGIDPEILPSHYMYGNGQRDENFGNDPIHFIIERVKKITSKTNPPEVITSVIGNGYPRDWKQAFPQCRVYAFDINPLQLSKWGHILQTPEGAEKGYLVDAGVAPWITDLLLQTEPTILYLSNIVTFLQNDIGQIHALSDALHTVTPNIIICANPNTPGNDYFSQLVEDIYITKRYNVPKRGGFIGANIYTVKK